MSLRPCSNPDCITLTRQHVAGSAGEQACLFVGQIDARRAAGAAAAAARAAAPPERDQETLRGFAEDALANIAPEVFFGATTGQIAGVLGDHPDLWYPDGDEEDYDYRWTPRDGFMETLAEKVADDADRMASSFETVYAAKKEPWDSDSQQSDWCNQWIEANSRGSEPVEDITGAYPCNDGDWVADVRVPRGGGTADFRLTRNPTDGRILVEPIAGVLEL